MKHLSKNLIITVLALFLITFAFSSLLDIQPNKPETISLNALAEKINSGAVSKITVNGEDLEIELSDGTKSMSRKESETSVSQTLANYGVLPDKLLKVELDVKSPGGFGYWMGVLLPAIIPVIFMLLIFWFIFRQAKVGANQALAFGRANFRIFSHKKDKITFKDVAGLKESKEELEEVVDFLKIRKNSSTSVLKYHAEFF